MVGVYLNNNALTFENTFGVLFFDIDNFKNYNDTYGHQEGDRVLQDVAAEIRYSVRKVDIPCRYGGEEFIIILPFTEAKEGEDVALRICRRVQEHTPVTVSVGVTQYIKGENRAELVKRVDEAMYTAKRNGKNQVIRM